MVCAAPKAPPPKHGSTLLLRRRGTNAKCEQTGKKVVHVLACPLGGFVDPFYPRVGGWGLGRLAFREDYLFLL